VPTSQGGDQAIDRDNCDEIMTITSILIGRFSCRSWQFIFNKSIIWKKFVY